MNEQKNELNDEFSYSLRPRRPDGSNVWKGPDFIEEPFNAQGVQSLRPIGDDETQSGVDKNREVIAQAREKIKPLAPQGDVILSRIAPN
jgi:hypothetical protein